MGNAFCTKYENGESSDNVKKYMANLSNDAKRKSSTVGGSPISIYGGYSSLEEYGNSVFSKAKEDLIRSIAADVAGVLKINPSYAKKADLKDVISKFAKIVPNPRKGRNIKVDTKIHIDICKKLAHAINKNYKSDMINVNDTPERLCQVVSETIYSLFTGLHSEFLTVAADVSRIMQNLNALQEYVDGINTKILNDLEKCSPGEAQNAKDAYSALTREIHRQHAYLANLTSGVIGPTTSSLIHLIEEDGNFAGLTKDLTALTGSREFSDKLSHMMSGASSVSHAAYLVDKALKQLGISVGEYKSTKNMKELRSKIYNTLVKKKPNSKEMHKLLIAADVLYRNDLAHDDIAAHLNKKGGDVESLVSGGAVGNASNTFAQLVSDGMYKSTPSLFSGRSNANRASIKTQIHRQDDYRKKVLSSFNQQLRTRYNAIINDLSKISNKIGSEIKTSDNLRRFIRQLGYFAGVQPNKEKLYKALSGYKIDIKSEYVKHDYMQSLETIKSVSAELIGGSGGMYFKSLNNSISNLLDDITNFNETFVKTLTEVHVDINEKGIQGAGARGGSAIGDFTIANAKLGGYQEDFKFLITIKKAVREIEYYFKIANVKKNLKIAASQNKDYAKNYDNILGEECGILIDKINKTYKYLTCTTETDAIAETEFKNTPRTRRTDITREQRITSAESYINSGYNASEDIKVSATSKSDIRYDLRKSVVGGATMTKCTAYHSIQNLLTVKRNGNGIFDVVTAMPVNETKRTFIYGERDRLALSSEEKKLWGAKKQSVNDAAWDGYVFLMEYIRSAKVEMIEAAQALDLYLSKFTEHVQLKPDNAKDFLKLLEQIEIVAKWFTDKSGDNLVNVFESNDGGLLSAVKTNDVDGKKDVNLGNSIIPITITDHYYKHIKEKVVDHAANFEDMEVGVGKIESGVVISDKNAMKEWVIKIEKSFKSMRALENIIAMFSKFNIEAGVDLKGIMSPGLIFKAFMKYASASSIAIGRTPINRNDIGHKKDFHTYFSADENYYTADLVEDAGGADSKFYDTNELDNDNGTGAGGNVGVAKAGRRKLLQFTDDFKVYVRPLFGLSALSYDEVNTVRPKVLFYYYDPLHIGSTDGSNPYIQTDEIFEMSIKSMISKVFTVVGTFSLFNKPAKDFKQNMGIANHPIRQIIGGGSNNPQIIPEATELYIRLTLLGEWYKELFDSDSATTSAESRRTSTAKAAFDDSVTAFETAISALFNGFGADGAASVRKTAAADTSATDLGFEANSQESTDADSVIINVPNILKDITKTEEEINNKLKVLNIVANTLPVPIVPAPAPAAAAQAAAVQLISDNLRKTFRVYSLALHKYRAIIGGNANNNNNILISVIPSFDGIWNKFIKVLFVDAKNINDGGYTESFTHDIINGINDIYLHYKGSYGADSCYKILETFVAEINLRYGLIKKSELDEYTTARFKHTLGSDDDYDNEIESVDFDTLNSNDSFSRNTVPSDKFIKQSHSNSSRTTLENKYLLNSIRTFRTRVENSLQLSIPTGVNATGDVYSDTFENYGLQYGSVDDLINQTKKRITESKSEKHKYDVIQGIIRGVESYGNVDYDVMLMFHETVINPLTILYTTYKMINDWNRFAISLYIPKEDIGKTRMSNEEFRKALIKLQGNKKKYFTDKNMNEKQYLCFSNLEYLRYLTPYDTSAAGGGGDIKLIGAAGATALGSMRYLLTKLNNLHDRVSGSYAMGLDVADGNAALTTAATIDAAIVRTEATAYDGLTEEKKSDERVKSRGALIAALDAEATRCIAEIINPYNFFGEINHKTLFNDLLYHLYYLTCDKNPLCELYFTGQSSEQYPMLSFKKLEEYCVKLFSCVEYSLNKFRDKLPHDIIQKYEGLAGKHSIELNSPKTPNVVSLFYIKEHLMERLIQNKYGAGLSDSNLSLKNMWLNMKQAGGYDLGSVVSRIVAWDANAVPSTYLGDGTTNNLMNSLSPRYIRSEWSNFPINKIGVHKTASMLTSDPNGISKYFLEQKLNTIPPNDLIRNTSGIGVTELSANIQNTTLMMGYNCLYDYDSRSCNLSWGDHGLKASSQQNQYGLDYNDAGSEGLWGIVFKFNRLLYHYINMFTDNSSGKIYLPLLESFANGVNSNEIMKGDAIDDISPGPHETRPAFLNGMSSSTNSIIFATMAHAIKNIVTLKKSSSTVTILTFAESNLLNVSEYVKDMMAAYLPIFEKELNIICATTEMLSNLISKTNIEMPGPVKGSTKYESESNKKAVTDRVAGQLMTASKFDTAKKDKQSKEFKTYMTNLLAHINASARSLQKCVTGTYKELSDIPIYFELYKGSITDYKNRNNMLPFMPLSHVSHLLNNQNRINPEYDTVQFMYSQHKKLNINVTGGAISDIPYLYFIPVMAVARGPGGVPRGAPAMPEKFYPMIGPLINKMTDKEGYTILQNANNASKNYIRNTIIPQLIDGKITHTFLNKFMHIGENITNATAAVADGGWQWGDGTNIFDPADNAATDWNVLAALFKASYEGNINNQAEVEAITAVQVAGNTYTNESLVEALFILAGQSMNVIKKRGVADTTMKADHVLYFTNTGLLPHSSIGPGSDAFKFAYGTRGLLSDNSTPNIELAPGVLGVLDTYNSKVGGGMSYDKNKIIECFKYSTYLLKYNTDYIYHKTYLGDQNLDKLTKFFMVGNVHAAAGGVIALNAAVADNTHAYNNVLHNMACQTGKHAKLPNSAKITELNAPFFMNSSNITQMVSNDNYKNTLHSMLDCVMDNNNKHELSHNRKNMRIFNILDVNIVPINFHALQREIAFANLFNYSYTFDQMIKTYFGGGLNNRTVSYIKNTSPDPSENTGDAITRRLIDPYGVVSELTYVNSVGNIMSGHDKMSLGTPKYLSDQLWNKVLLNTLYGEQTQMANGKSLPIERPFYARNLRNSGARTRGIGTFQRSSVSSKLPLTISNNLTYRKQNSKNRDDLDPIAIFDPNAPAAKVADPLAVPPAPAIAIGTDQIKLMRKFTEIGYRRYNTFLVRHVEWFTQLQRVMRFIMRNQLSWVNDPIVHKANALNTVVTEYNGTNKFQMDDFE
jgi:hypothetical protein